MPKPVIFLGADHAGFELKEQIKQSLDAKKYTLVDLSPKFVAGDDYPKHALHVARHVAKTKGARGILVCGSGVGVSIAANRIKKVRAFDAYDAVTTKLARLHNDANVIALSGWRLSPSTAKRFVHLFLSTKFSPAARHHRRVKQLG